MKTLTAALSLAALATGTAGATIAYVSTAPGPTAQPTISSPATAPEASVATRPGVKLKVRFRKCRAGAQLEHGKCVRHVVRTVIEQAPAVAVVRTRSTSSQSTGGSRDRSRDDHGDRGDGPPEVRQDTGGQPDAESDHESEGSEDHAPDAAAETDD
jgi:hypothetical protein